MSDWYLKRSIVMIIYSTPTPLSTYLRLFPYVHLSMYVPSAPYGALLEVLVPYPEILYSGWPVGIDPTPCIWGGS